MNHKYTIVLGKDRTISLSGAWDEEKYLTPRRKSNPCPRVNRVSDVLVYYLAPVCYFLFIFVCFTAVLLHFRQLRAPAFQTYHINLIIK